MSTLAETRSEPSAVAALAPLIVVVFTGFMAIGLSLPVLSLQVHDVLGYDAVTVGWVIGIQSFSTVLSRPLGGGVTDRYGPKRCVLLGLPLASASGLAYLMSTLCPGPGASLVWLVAGRLSLGLAESLFLTGTMTWGIGRIGAARTGRMMAWQGIAIFSALGLGAPIGLAIMQAVGFAGIAWATILLPLAGLCVAAEIPPVRPVAARAEARLSFPQVLGLIWPQGLALALSGMPFAALSAFAALYFGARGWSGTGFALSGFGVGYVAVRLFFAHLPDRFGGRRVAAVSLVLEGAGQALLWLAPNGLTALAGATLTGIGFSLIFPALGVEAVRLVPPQSRGSAVGGYVAFLDLSLGLTGPVAGLLVNRSGYASVFLAGAIACLAGLCAVVGLRARPGPADF